MKATLLVFLLISPITAFSDCKDTSKKDGGTADQTIFGGCTYLTPAFRTGYSSKYNGFITLGAIVPTSQLIDAGVFVDKGLILAVTEYNSDSTIYDIGYIDRLNWLLFSTSWEIGVSYKNAPNKMQGIYFGYSKFIGMAQIRYLKSDFDAELSFEIGYKY